jgi:hypothetical protein
MVTSDATCFLLQFDVAVVNPNGSKRENRTAKKPACNSRNIRTSPAWTQPASRGIKAGANTKEILSVPLAGAKSTAQKSPFRWDDSRRFNANSNELVHRPMLQNPIDTAG